MASLPRAPGLAGRCFSLGSMKDNIWNGSKTSVGSWLRHQYNSHSCLIKKWKYKSPFYLTKGCSSEAHCDNSALALLTFSPKCWPKCKNNKKEEIYCLYNALISLIKEIILFLPNCFHSFKWCVVRDRNCIWSQNRGAKPWLEWHCV